MTSRLRPRVIFFLCAAAAYFLNYTAYRAIAGNLSPVFVCQLRVPKSVAPNPKKTRISLATSMGEDAHFLWGYNQKVQKEEGRFFIFEPDEFPLFTEPDDRRALIIDDFATPQQVFRLALPRKPKAQDWGPWLRPDFLGTGDLGWAFIYNRKIQGVITNIPSDCIELRYKVELRDLSH